MSSVSIGLNGIVLYCVYGSIVGAGSRPRAPKAPVSEKMPLRGTRPAKAGAYAPAFLSYPRNVRLKINWRNWRN